MTLVQVRKAKDITQAEAARRIGINRMWLIRSEQRGVNSVKLLRKMAEIYGVTFEEIVAAEEATRSFWATVDKKTTVVNQNGLEQAAGR